MHDAQVGVKVGHVKWLNRRFLSTLLRSLTTHTQYDRG